jgi:hypothetical protein
MRSLKILSLIYELNIPFKQSADYRRLLVLIYGLGLISVWYYAYPIWISLYVSLGILVHGYHLFRIGKPYAHYQALSYRSKRWFLSDEIGHIVEYDDMCIQYDMRFVLYLVLKKEGKKRHIIFFHDQLTDDMRRALYLLQLSNYKSSQSYPKIDQEPAE